jgi:nucleoid-associated protein YgaU
MTLGAGAGSAVLLASRPVPPPNWTSTDLAAVAAWATALACCAWIALLAVAGNLALGLRRPRLASLVLRLSPRFFRRLSGIAVAGSTVLIATVPARAAFASDEPVVRAPAPVVAPPPPRRAPRSSRGPSHIVVAGDNLWNIARAELIARGQRVPADDEIASYLQAVITANRARLRSHDPNLIFAGEVIVLPTRG